MWERACCETLGTLVRRHTTLTQQRCATWNSFYITFTLMEILSQIIQDTVLNFQQFPYKFKCPKGMSTKEPTYLRYPRHCAGVVKRKKVQDITYKKIIITGNREWVAKKEEQVSECITSQEEREATVLGQTWKLHENDDLWGTGYVYMRVFWLTDNSIGEL